MADTKTDEPIFLGYDIGGTKIAVCVADASGSIFADARIEGGTQDAYENVFPHMVEVGRETIRRAQLSEDSIAGCGISAPGPLDLKEGRMLKSPNMAWENVPILRDLREAFNKPAALQNDANAGALAEHYFGAGQNQDNMIYLTMSTGIGGGVIANGQLIEGTSGNAAELGHIVLDPSGPACGCGMCGCLEAFCGGQNVATRLRKQMEHAPRDEILNLPMVGGDLNNLNYKSLREAVRAEIPEALDIWDQICFRLAQGVGTHIMTFNPDVVILGTVAYYSGELMMKPLREYLPRFAWKVILDSCELNVTALGKHIGELSGIAVVRYSELG